MTITISGLWPAASFCSSTKGSESGMVPASIELVSVPFKSGSPKSVQPRRAVPMKSARIASCTKRRTRLSRSMRDLIFCGERLARVFF